MTPTNDARSPAEPPGSGPAPAEPAPASRSSQPAAAGANGGASGVGRGASGPGGSASGYRIETPTGVCIATGRTIADAEEYVAALVEVDPSPDDAGPDTGLARMDFSLEAWRSCAGPESGPGGAGRAGRVIVVAGSKRRVFASWRARRSIKASTRVMLVDDEALLELLEQLADQPERRRVAFRFVLALYLVRRRVLVLEGTGHHHSLLVRRRGDLPPAEGGLPLLEIFNPELTDRDVVMVTEQLGEIMGDEWPQSGAPGQSAASPARVVSSRPPASAVQGKG